MAQPHVAEDQGEVLAFLADPATHGGAAVERVDTHGAAVFLAGDRAWKLKRAVRFPYMDFGGRDRRRDFCRREVELNRRTAPSLYLGAVPVTRRADGRLALDGQGEPVDWVVAMRRFDGRMLFDRMAAEGRLDRALAEDAARAAAAFHAAAEPRPGEGGAEAVRWVADDNADEIAAMGDIFPADRARALAEATRAALGRAEGLIDRRSREGGVRLCHGDLHLRNIVLLDGRPTVFDGIEFDDRLTVIDVWYDLAFLLMDLERRGRRDLANAAMNAWIAETGDVEGLALLPLFASLRAAVRAKVGASGAAAQPDPAAREAMRGEARGYLDLALALLDPPPARLVGVGGLSGTGKTTLARALAPDLGPVPGAVVVRTDALRKRRAGVAETERLPEAAYAPAVTEAVYAEARETAARVLAAGHAAAVDAVHARPDERAALAAVARDAGVRFDGLWLEAPEDALLARVGARAGDASDADAAVVRRQLGYAVGPMDWARVPAGGGPEATAAAARQALGLPSAGTPARA
jgi:aminoglycoside phosphotransferase family enzyme/predicted kinase